MKLLEIFRPGAILPDICNTPRDEVIAGLLDALIADGVAPVSVRDELLAQILKREEMSTTGFGRGVAVPHVKHPEITQLGAAIGLCESGIDFKSMDKQPVYSVFLLLSPGEQPEDHLQAMETIFKSLMKDAFRRSLRDAHSVDEVVRMLEEADSQVLGG
ncbi:MAG: PTS sugar transporter subunit IIA [Phycisphaerales bacterium]|nr:PTS sugar transporter subunit IIA [Phycisphaerales bacterium]